jgi:hypothetical protein
MNDKTNCKNCGAPFNLLGCQYCGRVERGDFMADMRAAAMGWRITPPPSLEIEKRIAPPPPPPSDDTSPIKSGGIFKDWLNKINIFKFS